MWKKETDFSYENILTHAKISQVLGDYIKSVTFQQKKIYTYIQGVSRL